MSKPRFFVIESYPEHYEVGAKLCPHLRAADVHHILRVLRLRPGDELELVLRETWIVWRCRVIETDRNALSIRVEVETQVLQEQPPFTLSLLYALAKGGKIDTIARQASEMGVDNILAVAFERSLIQLDLLRATRRKHRLQTVAVSAAQQAHRAKLPRVFLPASLPQACEELDRLAPDCIFVAWEEEKSTIRIGGHPALDSLGKQPHVALVVGPEGGISSEEIALLRTRGAHTVSLGETILRIDTACVAALAAARESLALHAVQNSA